MNIAPMRVTLLAATVIAACGRARDDKPVRVTSVDQLVAASPDSAMKQRWRDAAAKGQLPSLESLPAVQQRVAVRTPAQVVDSPRTAAPPAPQQGVVATVRAFSRTPVEQYAGAFTITNSTANVIVGTLAGRSEPFELHFKLPDTTQLAAVQPNAQYRLRVRDELENQSIRRELMLSGSDGGPVLFYLSDGGMRPYAKRFPEGLSVTQRPPGRDSVAPVTVTLGGASTTLRPG
ncbi:MAG: hypothetical protein ACRENH_07365, partial [Gemmatimonadaceae bacterium]